MLKNLYLLQKNISDDFLWPVLFLVLENVFLEQLHVRLSFPMNLMGAICTRIRSENTEIVYVANSSIIVNNVDWNITTEEFPIIRFYQYHVTSTG